MTHNIERPLPKDSPTTKQLLLSTLIALITACVILVTAVLPAEYGIDPTGLGETLGLQKMGEIKAQLEHEESQQTPTEISIPQPAETALKKATADTITITTDVVKVTLAPGEAAEVKVAMKKSASTSYSWSVDTGFVNFDNHGDNPEYKYHNYTKGKGVTSDQGKITAAFEGKHGWFWRNRSKEVVTITLNVSGEFSSINRIL